MQGQGNPITRTLDFSVSVDELKIIEVLTFERVADLLAEAFCAKHVDAILDGISVEEIVAATKDRIAVKLLDCLSFKIDTSSITSDSVTKISS